LRSTSWSGSVEALLHQVVLIREFLGKAMEQRQSLPLFGQAQALQAIARMFVEPSILLKTEKVPLAQRGLLSDSERDRTISPQSLKEKMVVRFERSKRLLIEVEQAWEESGPKLDAVRMRAKTLASRRRQYNEDSPAVEALASRFRAIKQQLDLNPFSLTGDVEALMAPYLKAVEDEIQTLEWEREQERLALERALEEERLAQERKRTLLFDEVRRAQAGLETLRAERTEALQTLMDCKAEIEDAQGLQKPPGLKAVSQGLKSIEALLEAEQWDELHDALESWFLMYNERLATTRLAQEANRKQLDEARSLIERWTQLQHQLMVAREYGVLLQGGIKRLAQDAEAAMRDKVPASKASRTLRVLEIRLEEEIAAARQGRS
ncbi:MAG: hypothetical protein AAFX99_28545, partial [Myxococcota bacterium]